VDPAYFGLLGFGAIVVLIAIRVPIAVSLLVVSLVGLVSLKGLNVTAFMLGSEPYDFSATWSFAAVPMFLLVGALAHYSGMSDLLFRAGRAWLGWMPGGLAVATNVACAGFSAVSGSSVATSAAMGRIAIPQMLRYGYNPGLATGVVASAGTLGSMIPPSIIFVFYGIFAQVSIGKLFAAGVIPGLLTALVYAVMIVTRCTITPSLAPSDRERYGWPERIRAALDVWPLVVLAFSILGSLYSGFVTATEAGALGAFVSFLIVIVKRRFSFQVVRDSMMEAVVASSRLFFIGMSAFLLTRFLAVAGTGALLADLLEPFAGQPYLLLLGVSVVFIILGMFLDPIGIMLLTLPLLLPVIDALNLDPIWFGVLIVKYIEVGLLTPPVGLNVFVVKSTVGDAVPIEQIFRGVAWFLVCEVFVIALLIGFPDIALFLPSLLD